ncbi:MAG: YbjN domain-containing protein [Pseudomonadota bacterium]
MLKENNSIDIFEEVSNPIDALEDIMLQNDWVFDRRAEDELTVQITGKMGEYKMAFVWQEDFSALQFCCAPDLRIHKDHYDEAKIIMNDINSNLWMGHFDMRDSNAADTNSEGTAIPCFRHTVLLRGMRESSGIEPMEDIIDIAISESERYYMTFSLLSEMAHKDKNQLSFAMMNIAGSS